jgi:hypothetical protein
MLRINQRSQLILNYLKRILIMLSVDIKGCSDCHSISETLSQIDMEIYYLSKLRDQNFKFDLELCVDKEKIEKLIVYKRILERRFRNPEYMACCGVSLESIISRVKPLVSTTAVMNCKFKQNTFVN